MKKIYSILSIASLLLLLAGCQKVFEPQTSYVTKDQASGTKAFENAVNGIYAGLVGDFFYSGSSQYPWDYGYPSFYLLRDVQGQDIVNNLGGNDWYNTWYQGTTGMNPRYAYAQLAWTYYFNWIKNCCVAVEIYNANPTEDKLPGLGKALAYRALFYLELAQIYSPQTYTTNAEAITVPLVKEDMTFEQYANNPRATWTVMMEQILSDLNTAESALAGYSRSDVYDIDLSVVYGLKARANLVKGDWENARKYAKLAQSGYTIMNKALYTSRSDGFNKPNSSWMMAVQFKEDDANILENDGDSCWGSQMFLEVDPDNVGCGYAANYGAPKKIDRHLYETIPSTDFRKGCFLNFSLDDMDEEEQVVALADYTDHPTWIQNAAEQADGELGGLELKFRTPGSAVSTKYNCFVCSVPMMRVEEMYLIEAEAAGRINEAEGIELLTKFAKTRDSEYKYGTHTDAYYNTSTSQFVNEVWWQRRVELWGEGLSTFDIKRLEKGVIRSYAGTNHQKGGRFNSETVPERMIWPIVETEGNYNNGFVNNPSISLPTDSEEYVW